MTDIGTWCGWEVYLHEWNHQFDWTLRTDEAGDGYPITHHSDSCGHQPIPSMGYGHRASMHYYVTPAMYRRIEPADPDNGAGYLVNWTIGTPVAIGKDEPASARTDEPPPHHALEFSPERVRYTGLWHPLQGQFRDFIDLKAFLGGLDVPVPDGCVTPAYTYVHSPSRQEVRLWLGHNDGMAVWLNGDLIHRGDYYAIAKFEDQNWPNMVAIAAVLQAGWNRIDLAVESWPAPRNKGYGFAVRVCDFDNQPVPTLKNDYYMLQQWPQISPDPLRPAFGKFYRWSDVRDDFYGKLPRLTGESLAEYGRLSKSFDVVGSIGATQGVIAMGAQEDQTGEVRGGVTLRAVPRAWDRAKDLDLRLNNVMDWNREAVAVYPLPPRPGSSSNLPHQYLLLRPEAVDSYLMCLAEAPAARQAFADRPVGDRMLGYVQVGQGTDDDAIRVLILAEVCLPAPLPADEEDLLSPVAE